MGRSAGRKRAREDDGPLRRPSDTSGDPGTSGAAPRRGTINVDSDTDGEEHVEASLDGPPAVLMEGAFRASAGPSPQHSRRASGLLIFSSFRPSAAAPRERVANAVTFPTRI